MTRGGDGNRSEQRGTPGVVERITRKVVKGWVSVPADAPPTRVTLNLDDLGIVSTYASPETPGAVGRRGSRSSRSTAAASSQRPAPGRRQNLPGPGEDHRNTGRQIRWFRFRVADMWRYCDTSTRVSVRVDGAPLPIVGHGMFALPTQSGRHSVAELRRKLRNGFVISWKGKLQLSKQHDTEWQRRVMDLYERTNVILRAECGYEAFFVYGTLLGAVREGTYIGHDADFDAAYVSSESDPDKVTDELVEISLALIEHGLNVKCLRTHLHISDPAEPDLHIDLFFTYFDTHGELSFPFGVAGTGVVHRRDWQGVRQIAWPGGQGSIPVNAEQVVGCLYGTDWRQPKPGFHWDRDRVKAAPGRLTRAQRQKVYWANFYAHTSYTSGSSFFEFVNSRPGTPDVVIDIGCGDGRDSCAFGAAGRRVIGVDQSPIGVQHATARASGLGIQERVRFRICDVADTEVLETILEEVIASGDTPVLFYLRFFLHSIPEDVQDGLLDVISALARPDDVVAAEFRTEKDETASHVHGEHYRRYQNGPAFGALLRDRHFELLHEEEGTGLSPYQGEDPVLYRVVARRQDLDRP
jgi:hypothetical protein